MNSAIVIIKSDNELQLAKAKILGKTLIEYTLFVLKKLDLDNLYIVGGDFSFEGVINRRDVNGIVKDLSGKDGKCLFVSPFYPLIAKKDYTKLLVNKNEDGSVLLDGDGACVAFVLPNNKIKRYDKCDLSELALEKTETKRISALSEVPEFCDEMKLKINTRLIEKGVNIIDPFSTYISQDSTIDKNTTIYPNTVIEGKCLIGKDNVISGSSFLVNVVIGDGNTIDDSRISDSSIHNNCHIGPYAQIRNNSKLADEVRVGNYVEIKNSTIGDKTRIAHLAYIGDATIGDDVNIGCGAVTINYDGTNKYPTVIKNHAFIGSNSSLIAPITIGEYSMVAAGSTIDHDVMDGDMAISRLYQTNKKGFGYRYINKEN